MTDDEAFTAFLTARYRGVSTENERRAARDGWDAALVHARTPAQVPRDMQEAFEQAVITARHHLDDEPTHNRHLFTAGVEYVRNNAMERSRIISTAFGFTPRSESGLVTDDPLIRQSLAPVPVVDIYVGDGTQSPAGILQQAQNYIRNSTSRSVSPSIEAMQLSSDMSDRQMSALLGITLSETARVIVAADEIEQSVPAAGAWRSMDEAPIDGTIVEIKSNTNDVISEARYINSGWRRRVVGAGGYVTDGSIVDSLPNMADRYTWRSINNEATAHPERSSVLGEWQNMLLAPTDGTIVDVRRCGNTNYSTRALFRDGQWVTEGSLIPLLSLEQMARVYEWRPALVIALPDRTQQWRHTRYAPLDGTRIELRSNTGTCVPPNTAIYITADQCWLIRDEQTGSEAMLTHGNVLEHCEWRPLQTAETPVVKTVSVEPIKPKGRKVKF